MVEHCPSVCYRGSLEGGKKEEDFIEGGGVGVGAREEQGEAEGELPSSSCHPCATQCGRPCRHHIKGRWMSLVCLQTIPYLFLVLQWVTGGIAVLTYVVFNSSSLKEV